MACSSDCVSGGLWVNAWAPSDISQALQCIEFEATPRYSIRAAGAAMPKTTTSGSGNI